MDRMQVKPDDGSLMAQPDRQVVVTGVAGFIGSHLARELLNLGYRVLGIDYLAGHPQVVIERNLAPNKIDKSFTLVRGDLTEVSLIPWFQGVDTIFHLAACPGVRGSWGKDFARYVSSNILATHLLMDAAIRSGVRRVVVSSSSSIYGGASCGPVTETNLPAPLSPYGVTKLAAEQLALAHARRAGSQMTVVALRYFTVYGPRQREDMLISRLITSALTKKPITILGDGRQRRDFTFVEDAVRANLMAMHADVEAEVINIGTGVTTPVLEVAEIVGDIAGMAVPLKFGQRQAGDVRDTHADVSLARAKIGYLPTVDLRSGLKVQFEWARANKLADRPT
ncbi:NAD-dependent epimerase/dehydratase family protein [Nonomuraea sp. NBC_00507]|uniref:NAD-dependent epimerase/dehydratase family protein n=1 Tax=Nonomuraea sp. NBC_00507 TaxID=2976002 RepID=UPI002E178194